MISDSLKSIDLLVRKEFENHRRLLSFEEYLGLVAESPESQLRGSAEYMANAMDFFGKEEIPGTKLHRFKIFDEPQNRTARRVVGQIEAENELYRSLKSFARQGLNNKLILLHGPNGSAKSSIIQAMMAGLETYSQTKDGALYTFSWVFPVDQITKSGIGISTPNKSTKSLSSYARLPEDELAVRIPCELKDHPLLVIPVENRKAFLTSLLGAEKAERIWSAMPLYLTQGALSHNAKQISEALLVYYQGDFKKVLMHVQVERFFYSRRYRSGLVTIEPQMHVDAQYHQVTYNKAMSSLPTVLQNLSLHVLTGDLVDGNRGIVEFSDLLKRPIDSFKYLLTACETNSINVGQTIAFLDSIFLGSSNELQLDAFKEFPDFMSFKARIDLIRVPYLMRVSDEAQIYENDLKQIGIERHVAPHTAWSVALWSVLTRLKKPNSINYPPALSQIVSNFTPIEKAKLYDTGEMPVSLSPEDRKLLKSNIKRIRDEYISIPYYEGRMGASAREMRSILFSAAQNPEFVCLSPLALFREMEEFIKRVTEYEFLKQDVKDGFHDAGEFITTVRNEYLAKVDREVRDCLGLYDSAQWEEFLKKYVTQISSLIKKEKIKNPMTGQMEAPDMTLIQELERIVDAPSDQAARESFRQNVISQIGAWVLDHPKEPVAYGKVFPEFWQKLEKHYYEGQKTLLTKMQNALSTHTDSSGHATEEGAKLANQTVSNMVKRMGYCEHCAKDTITFLLKSRY